MHNILYHTRFQYIKVQSNVMCPLELGWFLFDAVFVQLHDFLREHAHHGEDARLHIRMVEADGFTYNGFFCIKIHVARRSGLVWFSITYGHVRDAIFNIFALSNLSVEHLLIWLNPSLFPTLA